MKWLWRTFLQRIRPLGSLQSIYAADKVTYFSLEKWCDRTKIISGSGSVPRRWRSTPSMRRPIRVKGFFPLSKRFFVFSVQPSRLCRHPSIRTRSWAIFARCQLGVLVSAGAATWFASSASFLWGKLGRGVNRTHLNSAVELGCSLTNFLCRCAHHLLAIAQRPNPPLSAAWYETWCPPAPCIGCRRLSCPRTAQMEEPSPAGKATNCRNYLPTLRTRLLLFYTESLTSVWPRASGNSLDCRCAPGCRFLVSTFRFGFRYLN